MTAGLVTLTINGHEIAVPPTKPAYDPQFKTNVEIPTTIYDAALALSEQRGIDNPIPVLCHREHINPVAVCRMCVVEVKGARVLAPACYRPVENGMVVETAAKSARVRGAVTTLTQLLLADHPSPCEKERLHHDCELEKLGRGFGVTASPYAAPAHKKTTDVSSLVIAVDHNACILCDRCVRACNDIRDNQVIGRMGKGYRAQIAFDLNDPMGDSSCVACGECMISCPTGALVNRSAVAPDAWPAAVEPVPAAELARHPLFEEVSHPFLRFNEGSVVRRRFRKGDVICREGEFGSTAYLIESGNVNVTLQTPLKHLKSYKSSKDRTGWGLFGLVRRFTTGLVDSPADDKTRQYIPVDAPVSLPRSDRLATLGPGDLFGEMTCMNHYPRSATVTAEEDCVVLEMLRNVLYILQRNKKSRSWLEARYRERSIHNHLRSVPLFTELFTEEEFQHFVDFISPRVHLKQIPPGEVIFRQGDPADHFYFVRIGFVKVSQHRPGGEQVLTYLGPGSYFGEIGLLGHLPEISERVDAGVRTATCSALDHVDLVVLPGRDFLAALRQFPQLEGRLRKRALEVLEENEKTRQQLESVPLGDFLQQGLMNANSLLVLDLEKCTRCDECTKACADSHDGVTRLIREGLRFDKFLVASSCRSCLDPYCMVGCPVGSIRRRSSMEIVIEDWCIGCGLCANNCPYGNINMHPFQKQGDAWVPLPAPLTAEQRAGPFVVKGESVQVAGESERRLPVLRQKATMCDLCSELDGQPSCVYACPHDAAHRMSGKDMIALVRGNETHTS